VDDRRVPELRIDGYLGAARPYVAGQVTFDIAGPAVLVGDNPFDFAAAGGAGAVWIRSLPGARGTVTIRARHPGLGHASAQVRVCPAPVG
jgi:beta-galactosidase